jgi:regulatory protein
MPENEKLKSLLNRAMALCARRELCISEVMTKLSEWGATDSETATIIEILKKENFINEERYSIGFAKDKFRYNKWGKIKIGAHLKAKNIPGELIKKSLDTIDNDNYNKTLTNLLSAHRRSVKAKNQYDLKAKLLRYGISKGFESSLLYDLLNMNED